MATAPSPRRIGATDSKRRSELLDAAEVLLLEEGYAAVTSRRLAAKAGLKPQLVHYYFRTMDDLLMEVFQRRAEENLRRIDEAIAADPSLQRLWELNADPRGAAFMVEFVALANHRKELRVEIARSAERFRAAQLDAVTAALRANGVAEEVMPPVAALLLMTGVTQIMGIEQVLGVTSGHEATRAFIAQTVAGLDAARPTSED